MWLIHNHGQYHDQKKGMLHYVTLYLASRNHLSLLEKMIQDDMLNVQHVGAREKKFVL